MVSGVQPKKGVVKESQALYAIFNHVKSAWSVDNFPFKSGFRLTAQYTNCIHWYGKFSALR